MTTAEVSTSSTARPAARSAPAYQAFLLLRTVFTVAPILFGLDKFANFFVRWPGYMARWIDGIVPGTAQQAMYAVGVIEVVAGVAVRCLAGGRLASRDHRQPADLPGLLRHSTA